MFGYAGKRLFAQFEECRFAQKVECGSTAYRLFCKDYQIRLFTFCTLYGIDDFGGVAVDVANRLVQLSKSDFHLF